MPPSSSTRINERVWEQQPISTEPNSLTHRHRCGCEDGDTDLLFFVMASPIVLAARSRCHAQLLVDVGRRHLQLAGDDSEVLPTRTTETDGCQTSALQVEQRFEFVEGLDVMRRGRRTRNAGTQRLNGADAEADTDGDLGVVIIAHDEHLIGL